MSQFSSLFQLRGQLRSTQKLILIALGFILFILLWWVLAELFSVKRPIVKDYNTHLPSSINQDSSAAKINIDSLLRADSLKLANATEFEKVYPLLPRPDQTVASYPKLFKEENLIANTLKSILAQSTRLLLGGIVICSHWFYYWFISLV